MHNSVGTFVQEAGKKANPSLPTLKPELLKSLKSRAEDQTHKCQTQRKITGDKFLTSENWKLPWPN